MADAFRMKWRTQKKGPPKPKKPTVLAPPERTEPFERNTFEVYGDAPKKETK